MSQEWKIQSLGKQCDGCRTPFADAQAYVTRLMFDAAGGYTRADHCEPCWNREANALPRFSSWKGVYHVPPPPDISKLVRHETVESLLRELIQAGDPARRAVIYILAVMLERKRLLMERDVTTAEDGSRIVVYEHRKTAETFVVHDPQLKLDQLEAVQQSVMQLLAAPAEEAATTPEAAAAPDPKPA